MSTPNKSQLRSLFASSDLDTVVWQDSVDHFADGAPFVDVVVSSTSPAFLQNTEKIALGYWPGGPVVRGVQNYTQGQSITFKSIMVKPGADLIVAMSEGMLDGPIPVRVDVTRAGGGAALENERRGQGGKSALEVLLGDSSTVLAVAVGLGLLYLVLVVKK